MLTRYTQHNLTWVDLVSPTTAEVRQLMQEFGIEPSVAQELLIPSFSQKIQRRGDTLYLVLHFPALHGGRASQEVDFVIGKNFLITTRYESIDPLHVFAKAFEVDSILGRNHGSTHGGHLFVQMVRNLYRALVEESEILRRRLMDIEEQVFGGDERRMVIEISHAGRVVHDFRQSLLPHKEILIALEPMATRLFGQEFTYYLHELNSTYERVHATIQNLRESLNELRETNNSLLTTKQNEIMKVFTVLAFVTFPLSLLVSLVALPSRDNPILPMPYAFPIVVGTTLALAVGAFMYFKHKKWL